MGGEMRPRCLNAKNKNKKQKAVLFYLKLQHNGKCGFNSDIQKILVLKNYLPKLLVGCALKTSCQLREDKIISHLIAIGHDLERD
jgi:hypothetical protein